MWVFVSPALSPWSLKLEDPKFHWIKLGQLSRR